ncbi:MAG: hypothetical protein ACRDKT_09225 [Actinomycetota bacterium]
MNGSPLGFGSIMAQQRIQEMRRGAPHRRFARGGKHDSGHHRRPSSSAARPRPAPGR